MRRLYNAVCSWLEADAQARGADEPQPEGNNFTQAEHAHAYTSQPEMHAGHRGTSIDDDDGGAYRLGFQRNREETP